MHYNYIPMQYQYATRFHSTIVNKSYKWTYGASFLEMDLLYWSLHDSNNKVMHYSFTTQSSDSIYNNSKYAQSHTLYVVKDG